MEPETRGKAKNGDAARPHSMYFREYRPREYRPRTVTEYYTTEHETEFETMTHPETNMDTILEIEETEDDKPTVQRKKNESDLLTAVKTLIIVFLFAMIFYVVGREMGYFAEEDLTDNTMKTDKSESNGGEVQVIEEAKAPERGELRKYALQEKKAIHMQLKTMET